VISSKSWIHIVRSERLLVIFPKCGFCHCFGAHKLIDDSKADILILKAQKMQFKKKKLTSIQNAYDAILSYLRKMHQTQKLHYY